MKKVGGYNQGIIKNERGKKWRRKVRKKKWKRDRSERGTEVEEGQRERSRKGKEAREKKK